MIRAVHAHQAALMSAVRQGRDGTSDLSWQSTASILHHAGLSWALRTRSNCFAEGGSLSLSHLFGLNHPRPEWGYGITAGSLSPFVRNFLEDGQGCLRGDFGCCSLWSVPSKSSSSLSSFTKEMENCPKLMAECLCQEGTSPVPGRERALIRGLHSAHPICILGLAEQ